MRERYLRGKTESNRKVACPLFSSRTFVYDVHGNPVSITDAKQQVTTFTYGYGHQLLTRVQSPGGTLTSDVFGNRKTKTDGTNTVAYIYDAANQLTEIRQGSETGALLASLVYDPNGNLITKTEGTTTTNFSYDTLDQLAIVSKTSLTQAYLYDGQGRRIKKTSSTGGGGDYIYSGPDIVAEYVNDNWTAAQATYTHGPNMDDPIIRSASTTTQYYHQDGLGSVVAVSDPTGATTGLARYDAWGNVLSSTGAIPQYGYTGRELDETGLIYYRGRYYDPSVGRFIQRDPMGLSGGMNLYAYVNNNPINFVDPWGLTPRSPVITSSSNNVGYYNSTPTGSGGSNNTGSQNLSGTGSGQNSGRADNYGGTNPGGSIATPVAGPTQPAFIPGSGEIVNVGNIKTSDGQTFPLAQQITVQFSTPQIKDGNVNPTVLQAFPNEDAKGGGTLSNDFRENNNLLISGTAQNGVTTVTVTVPIQISTDEHSGRSQTIPTYNQITVPGVSNQNAAFIVTPTTPCERTCNISGGYEPKTSK